MKIAVLFDGAGLARLGLEQAGHICTGYELDPEKHKLSLLVGSGNCILGDATKVNLSEYDGVWMSPPCQLRSSARTQGAPISQFSTDYLDMCLEYANINQHQTTWVENTIPQGKMPKWGKPYNAAQFLPTPIQNRNRMIGGNHIIPSVYHQYKKTFPNICPCITATEYKGCGSDTRRASRFYGRRLSIEECAYHQGLPLDIIPQWKKITTKKNMYEAIGNGVPVYMAYAFGSAHVVPNYGTPFKVIANDYTN